MTAGGADDAAERVVVALDCRQCGFVLRGAASSPAMFCPGCGLLLEPATGDAGERPSYAPRRPAGRRSVLVISDTQALRHLVKRIVEGYGHRTLEASNGEEGLRVLETTDVDLVISDYHMPRMTGIDMLARMRADPILKTLPVIVMSRESGAGIIRRAKSLGILDFIHKDDFYDPTDLKARLERHL